MIPTIEYRTFDKTSWGPGPWQDEPDKRQWQDPETGLPCLIVRNRSGALCGYVGVSPQHPLYEKDYGEAHVDCHGGLTFADHCAELAREGESEETSICHVTSAEDKVWWFGFDCNHYCDRGPAMDARDRARGESPRREGTYKSFSYVTSQVTSLAKQLSEIL